MTRQIQEVGESSVAAQAGRDVTITNNGLSAEECKALVHSALVAALPLYKAEMEAIANERMSNLENKIVARIADEPAVSKVTLADPDFHYVLSRAHHAYARSGDPTIADTLVDLIADRAKQTDRTRLTLSLNDAVEKVALLTKNEFAELSLIYLLKLTIHTGITDYDKLLAFLETNILPFVDDVSEQDTSYLYLEAQNCGSIPPLVATDLRELLVGRYGGVLSNGTTKVILKGLLPAEWQYIVDNRDYVIPCLHDREQWQLNAMNKKHFMERAANIGMPEDIATNLWNGNEATLWSREQMVERIGGKLPKFILLEKLWSATPLKSFRLSTIGIAIGHANARRIVKLNADLSTWIT